MELPGARSSSARRRCDSGVDRILQRLAWLEARHIRGLDLDGLPGLRIASFARGTMLDGKSAKANQSDLITLAERICNAVDNGVESAARGGLGQVSGGSDGIDKF